MTVWHLAQVAMYIVKANTDPAKQAQLTLDSFLLKFQSSTAPQPTQTWQEQKAIWMAWGKALQGLPQRKAPKG